MNPKNGLNGIYRNTSFMYAAESSLIPDTIYTITLEEGLRDTFNDNATDEFKYTFKTEPFEMKVGNLFGVYFGKSPDTLNEFTPPGLPQQPLPGVTIIDNPTDPGPIIWTLESDIYYTTDGTSPDSILTSFADNAYIKVAPGSRTNTGISVTGKISTPIGVSASTYNPVFDHTMNFLAFSGIPDSTDYMNHVVIHPDDGTIHIKLDRNKLRFSADFWAKSNTEYSIKVLPTFHDIYGREIGDTVQVSFITPEFKLLNATINSTLCGDSIKAGHSFPYELHTSEFSMNINFSHPLDIASANENFDIIPSIKGQLTITTTNLHFNSTQRLIPDTQYTVIIGNGLKEQYGGKIDTTYSIKFRIEKFKLKSLAIGTAEEHSLFSLSTNSILDSTSLYGAVDIIPEKYSEGTYYLTDDSTGAYFIPDSTIVFGDEVTVTTDTTIKDIFGNECQNSLSINFLVNYLERLFKKRSN